MAAEMLFWRKPTDHPQDGDADDGCLLVADGIGGRYSIYRDRDEGYLLWWAHDNFIWEACSCVAEAKEKAEVDWQNRFTALER